MKKLKLSLAITLINSISLIAQSSALVTDLVSGDTITNGTIVYRDVPANTADAFDLNIKNISSSSVDYKLLKTHLIRNIVAAGDSAYPYFVFAGMCYPPCVYNPISPMPLNADQDAVSAGFPFSIHYDEATIQGLSEIKYRIYNTGDPISDFMEFIVHYNSIAVGIKEQSFISIVSEVFPSPAVSKCSLMVNSLKATDKAYVIVSNSKGEGMSVKRLELSIGTTTIDLNIENYIPGIYFVTLVSGNEKIQRKFVVAK